MRPCASTPTLSGWRPSGGKTRGGFAEFCFPAGGPNLLVEQVDKTEVEAHALGGQFVGLSVTVRDIRRSYDHLSAKGVCFEAPPSRQGWGGSRTWVGVRAQAVLMSVWRRCWQQGRSALAFLSQLLRGTMVALVLPP